MIQSNASRDEFIREREDALQKEYKQLSVVFDRLSNVRLFLFVTILVLVAAYFFAGRQSIFLILSGLLFCAFLVVVMSHLQVSRKLKHSMTLLEIHSRYKARVVHQFENLPDDGADFFAEDHDYASDLDLFGHGSLFHLLSVAQTDYGRMALRDYLSPLEPQKPDLKTITSRQQSVNELSQDFETVQTFEALGSKAFKTIRSAKSFVEYASYNEANTYILPKSKLFINFAISSLMIVSAIISFLSPVNILYVSFSLLLVQLVLTAINYSRFKNAFSSITGLHPKFFAYHSLFEHVEKLDVQSEYLKTLQSQLMASDQHAAASDELSRLHNICLFIQARSQPLLFLILNSFFLYDYYCYYHLQKWVEDSGPRFLRNLECLGEWEALMSLSMMRLIYPEFPMPTILNADQHNDNSKPLFSAKNMGHPLIPVIKQVRNDFSLPGGIAIITGSNMSGKTTLLRTVGINAVLAYAGTVCCADHLELSIMHIMTSMRIADNLESGLSTFYAELVRIERIIRFSKNSIPLLFLIDEIFRGTNSRDRTDGAQIVLNNLNRHWITGLMSTHDYQLCELNRDGDLPIRFYHFSERYDDEGIRFDYLLAEGISTSANAKYLMKMVGIE
ncbi:MAG: hypothetical protein GXY06_01715 [Clostridiaceae bacterium]|nr:hypothetical protein [Clostridiaceae bacterium]